MALWGADEEQEYGVAKSTDREVEVELDTGIESAQNVIEKVRVYW